MRSTAGNPGLVIDVTWKQYNFLTVHYVLPRTEKLPTTLVLKGRGDPRDTSGDDCPDACKAGPILLSDGSTGLRLGLHRFQMGTLYN